jgi:uncharacterized protein involved in exopolysaccharide biosynthesis
MVPLLLASAVIILTLNPSYEFSSQTILYTGLATGSSIEMDKTFNYQATNTAFDNLINIINSRETQEEVAIRLLALHLMLPEANPKYISKPLFEKFKLKIPSELYDYVANDNNTSEDDTNYDYNAFFPKEIDIGNYEKTVKNLTALKNSSTDNFVYEILSYDGDDHYSLKAISKINAIRISSSDLIKLSYTSNDPGICQQTLAIYNLVCIKNYKNVKENRSDAVVKYFENELNKAKKSLKEAEDKLLAFNKSSNIINYYEQSKAVAVVKEEMEVDFKKKKSELAGIEAATLTLESKLQLRQVIQEKSNAILEKKKTLGDLNFKIALTQAKIQSNQQEEDILNLAQLKKQSEDLTQEIQTAVDELYSFQNSIDGLPINKVLPDWMNNLVEGENLKAKLKTLEEQNDDFQEKYAKYAPAGANMKRIEREIAVSEQGYLEILHGLNLAKLKLQDSELSSDLKAIDPPFYPLSPNPSKRGVLVIAAAFLGGIFTLGIILVMEYFDNTLKNSIKATKKIGFPALGMIPKIILDPGSIDLPFIQNRLIEMISQNILQYFDNAKLNKTTKIIAVFSTQKMEGKTILSGNIAKTLKQHGKKILVLNYNEKREIPKTQRKFSIINKVLGYPDPRVDLNNTFLADASTYLDEAEYQFYKIDNKFYAAKDYEDILKHNNIILDFEPDFVIIEMPPLIYYNYPAELITNADLDILVCRSNRVWSSADETAISNLKEACENKTQLIVNGVDINEVEYILGDLPKNRSQFRKKMKAMFRFQFLTKNQI